MLTTLHKSKHCKLSKSQVNLNTYQEKRVANFEDKSQMHL